FQVDFVPPPSADPELKSLQILLAQNPDAYAAIIIEPLVLGAAGMVMYSPTILTKIRQLATHHNTLLIADEVLTAFGRTGKMFAWEHSLETRNSKLETSPDFLCLSKNLTAGYLPLGATLTTQKIFD